jgi:hypothetical protein
VLSHTFVRSAKQSLFTLLSLADLALTWWLLEQSDGQVYEANPVARWWLAQGGWWALACFKAAIVLLVLGLATVIHRSRPALADRVLYFACAIMVAVVLYSTTLCRTTLAFGEQSAARQAHFARRVCRCDAHDIPDLVGRLRAAGLELRLVRSAQQRAPDYNAYLTTTGKDWSQLHGAPRLVEFTDRWRGTVFCEKLFGSGVKADPTLQEQVQEWGDSCLVAGSFLLFGDPDLLARIRAHLA